MMGLKADLTNPVVLISLTLSFLGASSTIGWIFGYISRDMQIYILIFLFIALLILNSVILRQNAKIKSGINDNKSNPTKIREGSSIDRIELESELAKAKEEVQQWKRKAKDEEVKNQTLAITTQIYKFLEDRRNGEPSRMTRRYNPGLDENQRHVQWEEDTRRSMEYSNETMTIYKVEYLPKIIMIRQEFLNRNLIDEELERDYGNPVNPLGIEDIAVSLNRLAARLP